MAQFDDVMEHRVEQWRVCIIANIFEGGAPVADTGDKNMPPNRRRR